VRAIGNKAFRNCEKLTSVIAGNAVDEIGDDVFENCPVDNAVFYKNKGVSQNDMPLIVADIEMELLKDFDKFNDLFEEQALKKLERQQEIMQKKMEQVQVQSEQFLTGELDVTEYDKRRRATPQKWYFVLDTNTNEVVHIGKRIADAKKASVSRHEIIYEFDSPMTIKKISEDVRFH